MSRVFAYVRVSTSGQTTENQIGEIRAAGFTVQARRVVSEIVSGSLASKEREGFRRLLDRMEEGDVLVVTKIDRLGRNAMDVRATVDLLATMGIKVHCLALGGVDLTSSTGRITMSVINAVAEFERDLLIERTHAGLVRAKEQSRLLGRPAKLTVEQKRAVCQKLGEGASISALAREFAVSRLTIQRAPLQTAERDASVLPSASTEEASGMSAAFKGRHFAPNIILLCMRWYCRYALSYRDLEEMMAERGLSVDHSTIYRWVQHYAPELDRRVQWCRDSNSGSWYVDETYVKVRGQWMYLYRAIGDRGETLDFHLSQKRTSKAAKRFLGKALSRSPHHRPSVISTDKNPAYNEAIAALRREGRLAPHCRHRQVKYLNNRIESDHGKLKQRIRPVRGFQSQKTAHNAIRGFETMRMFRKGQFHSMVDSLAGGSEARFIGRLFQVFVA